MAKVPPLKPQEIVRLLALLGFSEVRQRGSHKQLAAQCRTLKHAQ